MVIGDTINSTCACCHLCADTHIHTYTYTHVIQISSLDSRVNMVSDWCTKLTVFFSKPPTPKLEVCIISNIILFIRVSHDLLL